MESRRSADTQLGRTSPKRLRPDDKPVISSFLNVYILKNQQKVFAYPRYLPDDQVSVWYYCTYHSAKLPPYPVLEAPIDVRYTPSDTFGLRLFQYGYPWIAMCPIHRAIPTQRMFSILNHSTINRQPDGSFYLKERQEWHSLETKIRYMCEFLHTASGTDLFGIESIQWPQRFGYRQDRPPFDRNAEEKMRRSVRMSKDAFVSCLSLLSFLVLLVTPPHEPRRPKGYEGDAGASEGVYWRPKWQQELSAKNVPQNQINDLAMSWITDFSGYVKRVGLVVDSQQSWSCPRPTLFAKYEWGNVPVFMRFNDAADNITVETSLADKYRKGIRNVDLRSARIQALESYFSNPAKPREKQQFVLTLFELGHGEMTLRQRLPESLLRSNSLANRLHKSKRISLADVCNPYPFGLQDSECVTIDHGRQGDETFTAFQAERQRGNEQKREEEKAHARKMQNWHAPPSSHLRPSELSRIRVFLWEADDDMTLARKELPRSQLDYIFYRVPQEERHFDGFHMEWDLVPNLDLEDESYVCQQPFDLADSPNSEPEQNDDGVEENSTVDETSAQVEEAPMDITSAEELDIESWAYQMHGFTPTNDLPRETVPEATVQLKHVTGWLGYPRAVVHERNTQSLIAFYHTLSSVEKAQPQPKSKANKPKRKKVRDPTPLFLSSPGPPSPPSLRAPQASASSSRPQLIPTHPLLWDLEASNPQCLIQRLPTRSASLNLKQTSGLRVCDESTPMACENIWVVNNSTADFYVGIPSCLTVGLILRNDVTNIMDVIRLLVKHNIRFYLLTDLGEHLQSPQKIQLGVKPANHPYRKEDWRYYRQLLSQLLSTPRGTAALRYGGIVGRIARDVLKDEDALSPGEKGMGTHSIRSVKCGEKHLSDYELSEDELALICGVYYEQKDNEGRLIAQFHTHSAKRLRRQGAVYVILAHTRCVRVIDI